MHVPAVVIWHLDGACGVRAGEETAGEPFVFMNVFAVGLVVAVPIGSGFGLAVRVVVSPSFARGNVGFAGGV